MALRFLVFGFLLNGAISVHVRNEDELLCGDWKRYENQKCFKLFDTTLNTGPLVFEEAAEFCKNAEPGSQSSMIAIKSEKEQIFVEEYIFTDAGMVDNVWIGARQNGSNFYWLDDTSVEYTNWDALSPKGQVGYCVCMIPDVGIGKWSDVVCTRRNYVACQKSQSWSLAYLQEQVQEVQTKFDALDAELRNTKSELTKLQSNPVPVGFVYFEYSDQPSPASIWPQVTWTDVTSKYAGLFFRALGGNSNGWGQTQEGSSPRIIRVYAEDTWSAYQTVEIPVNGFSNSIFSSRMSPVDERTAAKALKFESTGGEIRPNNQAVRIWRRTA